MSDTEQVDMVLAANQIVSYIRECSEPRPNGPSLGAILGNAIFRSTLADAGFRIVPYEPDPRMKAAFEAGYFKTFEHRYREMLDAFDGRS